jgi:DHA2 family methylenomycin A resistance protein-like MFS transporter
VASEALATHWSSAGSPSPPSSGAAFVRIESRRVKPMLPLSPFRSRTFGAATAIGLAVNVTFYGLIFVLSL